MRRRSMLKTVVGTGVSLCFPLAVKAVPETTSVTQCRADSVEAGRPDRFVESIAAVRDTLQTAESWGLDVTAADSLCVVILDRYRANNTKSPAIIQHCADLILPVSKGFAAMGKYRLAGLLHLQRVQLLEFVAGPGFSASYREKFLASDERSGYLMPGYLKWQEKLQRT